MRTTDPKALSLFAAAACLALTLAPAFAGAQEADRPAAPARPRLEQARPLARLDLTPDQQKALEAFRKSRQDEAKAFRDEMAKLRDEMRELAKDPQANRAKIDALIDKRAGLRAEREKSALRARAERDKIFTPEQLEKLRSLRTRLGVRARLAGRGAARWGRHGSLREGRVLGPRAVGRRLARLRALRRHAGLDRWRR